MHILWTNNNQQSWNNNSRDNDCPAYNVNCNSCDIIVHYDCMCRRTQRQHFSWRRQPAQNINKHHKVESNTNKDVS